MTNGVTSAESFGLEPSLTDDVPRDFRRLSEDHYRLSLHDIGIEFDLTRLRRRFDELHAELSVRCELAGARTFDGVLSVADLNLSNLRAREDRAKYLATRAHAKDLDWAGLLEEVVQRVLVAERAGTPSAPLHTFARPGPDAEHDIDGWRLLRDHPVIGFGDGGSAKSYLALYVAGRLAQRGLTVLYADWELGGGDHRDRLERLFGAAMPVIHYVRCDRPLTVEAERISREVRRLGVDFWIADSIAFATGGPPEAAEHATAYFRAVRQIGIGSLHLAHINKSEAGDMKPFGSSFWHNSARSTWFIKQATANADGDRVTIGLFNRKANLTRPYPAVGFQFEFGLDTTRIARVNLADVEDLAGNLPLWQRVAHLIKAGGGVPLTLAQISEELGAKVDSIKKATTRAKSTFVSVPGTDGIARIALVERRAS